MEIRLEGLRLLCEFSWIPQVERGFVIPRGLEDDECNHCPRKFLPEWKILFDSYESAGGEEDEERDYLPRQPAVDDELMEKDRRNYEAGIQEDDTSRPEN